LYRAGGPHTYDEKEKKMFRPEHMFACDDALITAWSIATLAFALIGAGVWAMA
jgi:hypothetical protein